MVFIDKSRKDLKTQQLIERDIIGFYHELIAIESIELTRGCENALRVFLCHSALPFCKDADSFKTPCNDYCTLLDDTNYCPQLREEIEDYMHSTTSPVLRPECGIQPGEGNVSSLECLPPPSRVELKSDVPTSGEPSPHYTTASRPLFLVMT